MAKTNINDINNKSGIADLTAGSFGSNGFIIADDTTVFNADDRFYCILCLSASQVDCTNNADGITHTAIPLVAGMQIFGVFSGISVGTGGKIVANKL